jgi:hypothetical protein
MVANLDINDNQINKLLCTVDEFESLVSIERKFYVTDTSLHLIPTKQELCYFYLLDQQGIIMVCLIYLFSVVQVIQLNR